MSDNQICDQCSTDTDIKNLRYFPSDTHICIFCINPGFNAVRELNKCQKAFNELYDKTAWISINDRLPKNGLRILFACKDLQKVLMGHHIRDGLMQFKPSLNGMSSPDDSPIIIDMTYWMPLPELPK